MDSTIWIALIGILGTLAGVWLGTFLQNRNLKRQREWDLHDRKDEWIRNQKQEKFKRILDFVEGSLLYVFKAKFIMQFGSKIQQNELVTEYQERFVRAMTIAPETASEDKKLAELVEKFGSSFEGTDKIIKDGKVDYSEKEKSLMELAGQIHLRISQLLVKTFD